MHKPLQKLPHLLMTICCLFLLCGTTCLAQTVYTNPDTGYQVIIEDDANLLSNKEEESLSQIMMETTEFGHALFKTTDKNSQSADGFARSFYKEKIGTQSGTLFLIDMVNRKIWIHSDGQVYSTITKSYANTITDNVYKEATAGNYYRCAYIVFGQINSLLEGHRIPQPMKYISNLLLALILALLINFVFVSVQARLRKPKDKQVLANIDHHFKITKTGATYAHTTKYYSPVSYDSDSSDSRSGGSDSSSGGSSDSSSGGGGGHSF